MSETNRDWQQTQEILKKISTEALQLAKKGQEHFVRLSDHGKFHLDASVISLKKERLYYKIGKEYVAMRRSGKTSPKINHLLKEFKKVEVFEKQLNTKRKT